jgi:hypothetical protein
VPAAQAATTGLPGAAISGLSAPSPTRGPRLEKSAIRSSGSTAATASAESAVDGVVTVRSPGPKLPAETTNSAPVSALIRLTAWLIGSLPLVGYEPRLMFTTSAFAPAHSIPAMIHESRPQPALLSTLPTSRSAPGATPAYRPAEAAPEPAIVDAVWVPCPCPSCTGSPGTKLCAAATWPARSGWPVS